MDFVIDIGTARTLVADQALWPLARDFLWDFAPQVHESWLDSSTVRWFDGSATAELLNRRAKKYILDSLGVEPCFHAFPKDDWSRLLLLDGRTLELIAKWLGALVCADGLRRVTDGATVRELKAVLPGVYPDVFGFVAYFRRDGEDIRDEREGRDKKDEAGYVVSVGFSILMSFLASLPESLVSRLKFKLPRNYSTTQPPSHQTGKLPNLPLLLKLRFPEAYKLCC